MRTIFLRILTAAGILAGLWLGVRYLLPLLMPFLLGAGLAALAEPMVRLLCKRGHLPRGVASCIGVGMAFGFLALLIFLLAALALRELRVLAGILPDLGRVTKSGIDLLSGWLQGLLLGLPGGVGESLSQSVAEFFTGGTALLDRAVGYVLALAGGMLSQLPDGALGIGTAIVSSFMISAKFPTICSRLGQVLAGERLRPFLAALGRIRSVLVGWLKAQVKLAGVTWGILAVGFLLLRIEYGLLWALMVAIVDAFPVLGTGTVLIPWSAICLLRGDVPRGIGLLGIYAVVSLTRSMLEPRLLGQHLGLDPLVTLFSLYAGYKFWGLAGMLLAPMAAVTVQSLLPQTGHLPPKS